MSSVPLYRASGLALLLAAVLVIIGLPSSFVFPPDSPTALAMVGVWTGGVVLVQLGLPGIVGFILIVGVVSLGGFVNVFLIWALVFGLLGLGWIGYVLLTAKGEAVPQPAMASFIRNCQIVEASCAASA